MAIDWDSVTALAPTLTAVSVAGQAQILAAVALEVDASNWGDLTDQGQLALARHLGAVALQPASGAGPLTSEAVGPVSRSFGSVSTMGMELGSTPWGREYARLRALLPCNFGFYA